MLGENMMQTKLLDQIKKLSLEDRIDLADAIWDSIEEETDLNPLSAAQQTELANRVKAYNDNPKDTIPWETVKAELDAKYK